MFLIRNCCNPTNYFSFHAILVQDNFGFIFMFFVFLFCFLLFVQKNCALLCDMCTSLRLANYCIGFFLTKERILWSFTSGVFIGLSGLLVLLSCLVHSLFLTMAQIWIWAITIIFAFSLIGLFCFLASSVFPSFA